MSSKNLKQKRKTKQNTCDIGPTVCIIESNDFSQFNKKSKVTLIFNTNLSISISQPMRSPNYLECQPRYTLD